jgi:hypothetical protein
MLEGPLNTDSRSCPSVSQILERAGKGDEKAAVASPLTRRFVNLHVFCQHYGVALWESLEMATPHVRPIIDKHLLFRRPCTKRWAGECSLGGIFHRFCALPGSRGRLAKVVRQE